MEGVGWGNKHRVTKYIEGVGWVKTKLPHIVHQHKRELIYSEIFEYIEYVHISRIFSNLSYLYLCIQYMKILSTNIYKQT